MNTQELARELGHPDAQKLLSGSMARLAYNGHDGFPRVIPVGFYWTGERIVVSTAPTSPKARALFVLPGSRIDVSTPARRRKRRRPSWCVASATLETVDGVTDEYLAAARTTMDESQLAEFERNVRSTYQQMVRISLSRSGAGLRLWRWPVTRFPREPRLRWLATLDSALHLCCPYRQ